VLATWALPGQAAGSSEAAQAQAVSVQSPAAAREPAGSAESGYDCDITDGLYATITANSFAEPKFRDEEKVKLKPEGFAKDIEVRVLWQSEPRSLAVLILGLATRSKDKMAQLWKSYLYDAGFHVMTFDSPFLPAFSERARQGVAGNLVEESKLSASLIAAFLEGPKAKGRVTQTGLVGISYGATLALNIAKMSAENRIGFRPQRILAFSPPVKMQTAARILDRFYAEDRWNYTLVELGGDLLDHKPVPKGQPVPFSASEMRAGISAAFRLDLKEVLLWDNRFYKLGLLPKHDDEYTRDVAGTWTFTRFIEDMTAPYWEKKSTIHSPADLWAAGDVALLLKNCPSTVHVVLAGDDPMNDPAELAALKAALDSSRLTILPRGGHMGYQRTKWVKEYVAKLFE
jgi:predicted alpha/beta-fold hydrolase